MSLHPHPHLHLHLRKCKLDLVNDHQNKIPVVPFPRDLAVVMDDLCFLEVQLLIRHAKDDMQK